MFHCKLVFSLFSVVLALALLMIPVYNSTAEASDRGSISGHVYQSDGVTPISGATVQAHLMDNYTYSAFYVTDENGEYTIDTLISGNYLVLCEASGYVIEYYNGIYFSGSATPVSVTVNENTASIDFTLDIGGTISGHVYQDNSTTPIEGARVSASIDERGSGFFNIEPAITNDMGYYVILNLPAGDYRVHASSTGYIPKYYDATYDVNEASLVTVALSENTPDVNFTLDTGGSISGHVYETDGITPIVGARMVPHLIGNGWSHVSLVETDENGEYTLNTLIPGNYIVSTEAEGYVSEYYDSVHDSKNARMVEVVGNENTPDINFTLDAGGSIIGHVYQSDNNMPIEDAHVSVNLLGDNFYYSVSAQSDETGSYRVTGLPSGNYEVRASASDYLAEYYDGVLESDDATLVPVEMPADTTDIDFSLDSGGSISGHVYEADGETPTEKVSVHIQQIDGSCQRSDETISDGSFMINTLPTGKYRVFVDGKLYLKEYYKDSQFPYTATLVDVTAPYVSGDINFQINRNEAGGSISGHIYENGSIYLQLAFINVFDASSQLSVTYAEVRDGEYTVSGLPPGSYLIQAGTFSWLISETGFPFDSDQNLTSQWYDNSCNKENATAVNISAGETVNLDFILEEGGTISGQIFESDNSTPAVAQVEVYGADDNTLYAITNIVPDGIYTVGGLPSGSYKIRAHTRSKAAWYPDVSFKEFATKIDVTTHEDITGINVVLTESTSGPEIISTIPLESQTGVKIGSPIEINFNKSLDVDSVLENIVISPPVTGTFSWTDHSISFCPEKNLKYSQTYAVIIGKGSKDIYFNYIDQSYTWSFTTEKKKSSGGSGGGGGGSSSPIDKAIETDIFGNHPGLMIGADGKTLSVLTSVSPDGKLTITLPSNTLILDQAGKPVTAISAVSQSNPPVLPSTHKILGLTYQFGPEGTTFNPPITFVYHYSQNDLPQGIDAVDLNLAYYDAATTKWIPLTGTLDTIANTITVNISHFSTYALIAPLAANISISSLNISPSQALTGDKVTITLTLDNTGGKAGTYPAQIFINGVGEPVKNVTVSPGTSQKVTFEVIGQFANNYVVTIDKLSGSFKINEPPFVSPDKPLSTSEANLQPLNVTPSPTLEPDQKVQPQGISWTLIGIILIGILIIGFVVFVALSGRLKRKT